MERVYLDYAATTPTDPEVMRAMVPYFTEVFGNPSSIHHCGQEAKEAVDEARVKVAGLIGAQDEEIIFTSGGTEADNFALTGVAYARESKGNHIITTSIEHHAVMETCRFLEKRGFQITYLPVDEYGLVKPEDVRKAIDNRTILISIMHANNEVGTIEPISPISKIAREAGIYFHSDAVQTVGHIPVDVNELGVDLLSISAHKLCGPKGVGVLYIRNGTQLVSLMHGGGQESQWRAGTHNVPGIVGLGKAAEIARQEINEEVERLTSLRDRLINGILGGIDQVRLNGHPSRRLPNNVNISVDFVEGESLCLTLDLEGICTSTGSACSSSDLEPSHVLLAMGLPPEQARSSLRFTMGKWTTASDIEHVLGVLPRVVARLRAMSPLLRKPLRQ
jgi:cysteine desulfurase